MILHRAVFHAKFGRAANLVAHIRTMLGELSDDQRASYQPRILTDVSGRFDTVILETTHADLAALGAAREAMLNQADASGEPSPMLELVEHGFNEYYTIES